MGVCISEQKKKKHGKKNHIGQISDNKYKVNKESLKNQNNNNNNYLNEKISSEKDSNTQNINSNIDNIKPTIESDKENINSERKENQNNDIIEQDKEEKKEDNNIIKSPLKNNNNISKSENKENSLKNSIKKSLNETPRNSTIKNSEKNISKNIEKESIKIVENDKNSETIINISEKNSLNTKSSKIDFPENKIFESPKINPIKIIAEDNYTNDIILENLNSKNSYYKNNINDNVNLFQFTEETYEDINLYYLNEFHLTSKNAYSTESEFEHLLNSQVFKNKTLLVNRLLSLNERQWNKENMLISDSLKAIRENYSIMEISLFIKYCRKLISLHNHFNWLVWALGYYYCNSLLYYKRQWFNSKEWNLPPVEGMDWIRGFEWKGLFIKVLNYNQAKYFFNEIKALNYAFLDFIQVIDCVKINNNNYKVNESENFNKKFLLSNELIFPLISYCVFNGIVFTVSVCINKYSYDIDDDIQGYNQIFETNFNNDFLKKKNDSISNINIDEMSILSLDGKLINDDIDLNNYSKDDLNESRILKNISINNLIKVIDDPYNGNKEKYKLMLINAYSLIPDLFKNEEEDTVDLIKCKKNENKEMINIKKENFYKKNHKELFKEIMDLNNSNYTFNSFENNLFDIKYKIIFPNEEKEIDEEISNSFVKLPLNQNYTLTKTLLEKFYKIHNLNPSLFKLIRKHNNEIKKNNCIIYKWEKNLKQKYSLINNSIPYLNNGDFIKHFENFCIRLNSKKHAIRSINNLKQYYHRFGINMSLSIFSLSKIQNHNLNELIQIYILSSIIKKCFYYNEGIILQMKIGIFERNKDFYMLNSNEKTYNDNNMIEVSRGKIYKLINGILNIENYSEDEFVKFFYKQLSFFFYLKYLKWIKLDKKIGFNLFNNPITKNKYSCSSLLTQFIISAKNNPFIFLNSIETMLNIRISPFKKFLLSISIENIKELKKEDIIIFDPKVTTFINISEISNYILLRYIHIYNQNLGGSLLKNLSSQNISKGSINALPYFTLVKPPISNYTHNNENTSIENNITNIQNISQSNTNILNCRNIFNNLSQNGNISNLNYNDNQTIEKPTLIWKEIIQNLSIDSFLPSTLFKMTYNKQNNSTIYKNLNFFYLINNYDIIKDYKKYIEQLLNNISSYDGQSEFCFFIIHVLTYITSLFFEESFSKSKEVISKMIESFKKQYLFSNIQCSILNLFEGLVCDKYSESEEFYSQSLIFSLFQFGDMRGKNCKGHPFMMIPLYRLCKMTLDGFDTNEYFKEMFRCLDYNILNAAFVNCDKNENDNYFYIENLNYFKNYIEKISLRDNNHCNNNNNIFNNGTIDFLNVDEINEQINFSNNFSLNYNELPICKYFQFPTLSSSNRNEKDIFLSKEYINFFLSVLMSMLFEGNTNLINEEYLCVFKMNFKSSICEIQKSGFYSSRTSPSSNTNLFNFFAQNNSNQISSKKHLSHYITEELLDKMYFKKYSPDGILVSFGYNNHNETTHDNYDTLVLPRLIYKLSDYNIKKIFCGNEHAFAINENNNLFSWGNNSNGQCGIEIKKIVKSPKKINFPLKEEIIMCSGNSTSSLILTKDNKLYSCGLNYINNKEDNKPILIDDKLFIKNPLEKIIKIQSGENYHIILTSLGNVYSYGYGFNGQLGLDVNFFNEKDDLPLIQIPQQITNFNNENITDISTGFHHSFAINNKYEVYGWGYSNKGQLGMNFCEDTYNNNIQCRITKPKKLEKLQKIKINSISCGENFSLFITKNNEIYTCGNNDKNQLGFDKYYSNSKKINCNDYIIPTQIESFCDLKVTKVSCGQNHCLAIVKDSVSNTITAWCWGDNNFGQLGLGLNIKRRTPTLINTLLEYNSVPFDVSCGKNFSIICLKRKGKILNDSSNLNLLLNQLNKFIHFLKGV